MAKWKWKEEKHTVNSTEVIDYGWYCENCGTDLAKYLRVSGYTNARSMTSMKRKKPYVDHCPNCGEPME